MRSDARVGSLPLCSQAGSGRAGTHVTRRLEGRPVAETRFVELRARVEEVQRSGLAPPSLVSVHRSNSSPFSVYLRGQARGAAAGGVDFRAEPLPEDLTSDALSQFMARLAGRADIDAVLLEHPLPEALDFRRAIDQLPPEKDVDGVGSINLGRLMAGRPIHVPAVVLAVQSLLAHYEIPTAGQRIAVLGRSGTVGAPMAIRLASRDPRGNATVTVLHSKSSGLQEALAGSHVIVSCAGVPGLLGRSVVPKDSVVVDVGLSTVPDPSRPTGVRVQGDARADELEGWVESFTPVPGGVGPVTVAELIGNAVHAWELTHSGGGR
ncbi:MAG: bifunctional 5,10-methylenetetrahydrofolate dehydrogenase/5,10-methenyltetrahydrofolate cyclohydrolase [Thermoplasmata archaeon]